MDIFLGTNIIPSHAMQNLNDYYKVHGTTYNDSIQPYKYVTQVYQYMNPKECMMYLPDIVQINRRVIELPDPQLIDIESELHGTTRYLSRMPSKQWNKGMCGPMSNNKGICSCDTCTKKPNTYECPQKIWNRTKGLNLEYFTG